MDELRLGAKIKELRLVRRLTLQDVARETGFSTALISQIENNNVSPPIATLSKISKVLDVKIGYFFEEEDSKRSFEVVRSNERKVINRVVSRSGVKHGYTYEALSFQKKSKKMEPFVLTISAETEDASNLYSHEGEEFLIVLKGKAELIYGKERIVLNEGDSVYFDSSIKHRLLSYQKKVAKVLAVISR